MRDADLILVLDEGKIVAQGLHEELVATSPLYREILGSQIQPGPGRGGRGMRWVGGIETMAQQRQRAANRGVVAWRLLGELLPYRRMLLGALGFILVSAGAQAAAPVGW